MTRIMQHDERAPRVDSVRDDISYYAGRAEWHRRRAAVAADISTRLPHEKLVALYLARTGVGSRG